MHWGVHDVEICSDNITYHHLGCTVPAFMKRKTKTKRKQYQKVQDVFHEQYWPAGAVLHMVDDLF